VPTWPLHIVFVATDPGDNNIKAVGVYASADVKPREDNWYVAEAVAAKRIPVEGRQPIRTWPRGQGMRRWARRNGNHGKTHSGLLEFFWKLSESLSRGKRLPSVNFTPAEEEDGYEGEVRKLLVRHRTREHKLRKRKIAVALQENDGRIVCEVPRCGFDFHRRYGELGVGFAEVHHKKPLSDAPIRGRKVSMSDLAIVCANCHRMIHVGGQCRSLDVLIPKKARES
jgi:predicted HNH restriction endonuclease